ncbi:MAG: cytochrome c [Hyphomicrobiaceae bacterium]
MPKLLSHQFLATISYLRVWRVRRAMHWIVCAIVMLPTISPAWADQVERGRALAERLCAECHLNPGQGEKQGEMGIPGFVAVAKRPNQTIDNIVRWLQSAPPMMPDHHLTRDEMEVLADFIMSLRGGQ